jgi:hypothetical protein
MPRNTVVRATLATRGFVDRPPCPFFNIHVPNAIETASSGRAKCRACGRTISKGELRFGEAVANAYAEGETLLWFHVPCAACARSEQLKGTLEGATLEVPERAWLERAMELGTLHHRVQRIARAERASSGRATCRACHELIEKGSLRIALQMFEESRMSPIGTIHAKCAFPYFGTADVLDHLERFSPDLSESDVNELGALVRESVNTRLPAAPEGPADDAVATEQPPSPEAATSPGLAKARSEAHPEEPDLEVAGKNGR